MTDPDPAWDFLPDDPARFFGLPEEYDRRMLRRAYNGWLRRYEPEKFPEEFKKIRAAFEELDDRLRYGRHLASTGQPRWRGAVVDSDQPATPDTAEMLMLGPADIESRLEIDEPERIYRDVVALESRHPIHYYILAVFSDVVEPDRPSAFGSWLLEGLSCYPDDYGLMDLFSGHVRGEMSPVTATALVRKASEVLRGNLFYYLTEPLWISLCRDLPFDEWRRLLEEAEGRVRGIEITDRLVFTIRVVRTLLFKADAAWLEDRIAWLEANSLDLPGEVEYEMDTLELFDRYRQERRTFLNENPLRDLVDRTLRTSVQLDEVRADRVFLECQQVFAEDGAAVMRAFPVAAPEVESAFLPYMALVQEVAARTLEDEDTVEYTRYDRELLAMARRLLNKLERKTDRSFIGFLWMLWNLTYLGSLVVTYPLAAIAGGMGTFEVCKEWAGSQLAGVAGIAAGVLGLVIAHFVIRKYVLMPVFFGFSGRLARAAYKRIWRSEVMHVLGDNNVSDVQLENAVNAVNDSNITNDDWLELMMHEDHGIGFYAAALRFAG